MKKLYIILSVRLICNLQFISYNTFAQHGVWTQKTNFGGVGRYLTSSFSIGAKSYVGTGHSYGGQTADFWEYNLSTDTWTQKANFGGGATAETIGISVGLKGYILKVTTNQFWQYDPSTNIWTQKQDYGGNGQSYWVGFSIGNKGYVGSTWKDSTFTENSDFWEYDPSSDTWTQKALFNGSSRMFAVSFAIGTKGYVGTGRSNYQELNDFWEYDPATNLWTQKANFGGGAREYGAGFSIGTKGYIGTGNNNLKDFWEYNPSTDTWIQVADIGSGGTTTATGFSIGNRGYIACGQDYTGMSKALWEFYPSIAINVISNGLICNNRCNGSATVSITLGNPPYTYLWSTVPPQNTPTATGLCPGVYTVTVTDSIISIVGSVTISTFPAPSSSPICLVTVDSLSQNNIIIWDKSSLPNSIDSFLIYREIATDNYQPIGAVPFDSLSLFIDTMRTKYFPNSGNPNSGTYRYKIAVQDTCGSYSAFSPFHNTVFIINNNGNFSWPQPYSIENISNPVGAYVLMRDDYSNGNWHAVNSVSGTQQSVTDPDYTTWQSTANWRVETQWNISCTPTFKSPVTYTSSFSNIEGNAPMSINNHKESMGISLSPNPTNGKVYINGNKEINSVEIYNLLGEKIYNRQNNTFNPVDLSSQPDGIYFISIKSDNKFYYQKILKQ